MCALSRLLLIRFLCLVLSNTQILDFTLKAMTQKKTYIKYKKTYVKYRYTQRNTYRYHRHCLLGLMASVLCCGSANLPLCQGLFKHRKKRQWQPQSTWIFPYEPGHHTRGLQRKEGGGSWRRDKDNSIVNILLPASLLESWDVCWTSKMIGKILRYRDQLPHQGEKTAHNCVGAGNTEYHAPVIYKISAGQRCFSSSQVQELQLHKILSFPI